MNLATYERTVRNAAIIIMLIGIAMLLYYFRFVFQLLIEFGAQFTLWDILEGWYSQIALLLMQFIGIALLLIFRKKGLPVIIGVCACVIALECALDAYLLLVEYKQIFDADPADFFQGVISLVIAAMLFFNAILYSTGAVRSASLIKFGAIALILLQLFGIIVELHEGTKWSYIFMEREFDLSSYLMLILVLQMSMSKFTRRTSLIGIIKSSIRDLRNSMMMEGVGIDRSTAVRFGSYNRNGLWCNSYSFVLTAYSMGKYSMTLTTVEGHIVGRINSVENNSGMNVFRFNVTGVWFDNGDPYTCDVMRFYGTDGLFIQLIVRDSQEFRPAGIPKIGSAILSSREEGTTTHRIRVKVSAAAAFILKHIRAFKRFIKTNTIGRIRNRGKKEE